MHWIKYIPLCFMKQTFIFNYEFLSYKKHKAND